MNTDDLKFKNEDTDKYGHVERKGWIAIPVKFSDTKTLVRFFNNRRYPSRHFHLAHFDKHKQLHWYTGPPDNNPYWLLHCDLHGNYPTEIETNLELVVELKLIFNDIKM
jgi:hypothetical protein